MVERQDELEDQMALDLRLVIGCVYQELAH